MKTPSVVVLLTATAISLAWGCSTVDERLGIEIEQPPEQFGTPDAGPDATPDPRELTAYCPSSQCPPGWTTCPDSRFPCDTNILADSRNCGGCGMACPLGTGFEQFTCNEGACKLECNAALRSKDCDGLVDNGCESSQLDPANCGACGVACAVGESCRWQDDKLTEVGCGCPPGTVDCLGCRDLRADDAHCAACNNACDPTGGPGAPQYSNMYYGCVSGQCGKPKCKPGFADCDGVLENGCETSIRTDDDCGYCGNTCGAGQKCAADGNGRLSCMCDPGLTFCQTGENQGLPEGYCVDVSSSPGNCGACGNRCSLGGGGYSQLAVCDFGKCTIGCRDGAADCNGSQADGCEIDTKSDPRNCGGCGITCDLTLGQACVVGKCVVEPCDQPDAGEVTR